MNAPQEWEFFRLAERATNALERLADHREGLSPGTTAARIASEQAKREAELVNGGAPRLLPVPAEGAKQT